MASCAMEGPTEDRAAPLPSIPNKNKSQSSAQRRLSHDEIRKISMVASPHADPRVAALYARFVQPTAINLATASRTLIKQGTLRRQARYKHVSRECFLFDDMLIVAKRLDNSKRKKGTTTSGGTKEQQNAMASAGGDAAAPLQLKQTIHLSNVVLDPRAMKPKGAHPFVVSTPERTFAFECTTDLERDAWLNALETTTLAYRRSKVHASQKTPTSIHAIRLGTVHSAALAGDEGSLRSFLADAEVGKCDMNEADDEGHTPLHLACMASNPKIVQLLLENCVNVNALNDKGVSPLLLALNAGNVAIVRNLVRFGARVDTTTQSDTSPIWICVTAALEASRAAARAQVGQEDTGGNGDDNDDDELTVATRVDCIRVLVKDGQANVDECNEKGLSPLYVSAREGHEALVAVLLELKASHRFIAPDQDSFSPLHAAAAHGATSCVRLLLQYGAYPNARDANMNTAWHVAKSADVAAVLAAHGAHGSATSNKKINAVDVKWTGGGGDDGSAGRKYVTEALSLWANRKESPGDQYLCLDKENEWIKDDTSSACLLCLEGFTLTRRRHHCRRCGVLVCASCSSKKFKTVVSNNGGTDSTAVAAQDLRACDSCFNFLASANERAHLERRRHVIEKKNGAPVAKGRGSGMVSNSTHFGSGPDSYAVRLLLAEEELRQKHKQLNRKEKEDRKRVADAKSKSSAALAKLEQNKRMLEERGERLREMEEKSGQLEHAASDFHDVAKRLRRKQQKRWF